MGSIYKDFQPDQIEELQSNYLIDSWSYSKVTQFARNPKAFEMRQIYGQKGKQSATTIAGQAYHAALDSFFNAYKKGETLDIATLEIIAFEYIDEVRAYRWKTQKTTPYVEDCKAKALTTVSALLRNFISEVDTYIDQIQEVLHVEVYCDVWLTVNGVDVPLPCHAKIDLVVRLKDGQIAIIDHKSKSSFSDEESLKLGIGTQAITYVMCFEEQTGIKVDQVWFIENKISKNKNGGAQLAPFKLTLTESVRRLYQALLYEPLRGMIKAVSDPDFVYTINESDNFEDKAEIYDFWAKTMIAEEGDFNVPDNKKPLIAKRLKKIRDASMGNINPKVIKEFRLNAATFIPYDLSDKNMSEKEKIEHVLRSFGIIVSVEHMCIGYSSCTYLLSVSAGIKIASIQKYTLDIANVLAVENVRISKNLVIKDGKPYVGIEFAKTRTEMLTWDMSQRQGRKIPVGIDNFGNQVVWDMDRNSTPHALVCGATGSGKSVFIKSTIEYSLPVFDQVYIFDPKFEFTSYKSNGKVKVFNHIEDIEDAVSDLVDEMNELVQTEGVRHTLVIFDEFADAVSAARKGKDLVKWKMEEYITKKGIVKQEKVYDGEMKSLEENMRILLQKGRSSGFRIMSATQRASTKVITGDAKVNYAVRICFMMKTAVDSQVVLDEIGAEALTGDGDGLISSPEYKDTVRFQGYYYAK